MFLLDGTYEWVLVHVEVQGYLDENFGWRMFKMFYRLIDRFDVPINQIAIFTDDSANYHPKGLSYKTDGSWFDYGFKTWKLLEHPPHTFDHKDNLFSIVMEIAWNGLSLNKKEDDQVYDFKTRLIRELLSKNVSKQKIKSLFNFIEHYVNFEDSKFFVKFEDHLYKNKQAMGLEEIIKEAYRDEGRKEGIEIGEQKGEKKGEQKGLVKGQETVFFKLFENGFTPQQVAKMTGFDLKKLKKVYDKWKNSQKKK